MLRVSQFQIIDPYSTQIAVKCSRSDRLEVYDWRSLDTL